MRSPSSSSTGCVSRIPGSRRRWRGLISALQRRERRRTRSCATNTSGGAASVTVRNIITSMRLISDVDWTEMFERVSLVDDVLAVGGGFSDMDFPTRNLYRTAVEELARRSNRSELDIARRAVLAAGQAASAERSVGRRSRGVIPVIISSPAGAKRSKRRSASGRRCVLGSGRSSRRSGIAATSAPVLRLPRFFSLCRSTACRGRAHAGWLVLLGALGVIPAIDSAVALVNRGVTRWFGAALLPGSGAFRGRSR